MLRIAKIAWVILVVVDLALYVLGGIVYVRELDGGCLGMRFDCHVQGVATPEDVANLQQEGLTLHDWAIANVAYQVLITSPYCVIAFLIFARKRNEWNGLLISYFLIAFGSLGGNDHPLVAAYPVLGPAVNLITYLAYVSFAFFFAAFPNGRVVPRAMWIPVAIWSFFFFLSQFFDWPPQTASYTYVLGAVLWIGMFVCGMLAQVYRYLRVSNGEQRRQTKWVLFGIVILVLSIVTLFFSPLSNQFGDAVVYSRTALTLLIAVNLILTLIPFTIGIAILRSRLFDIDVIIRRTLTYALVTALLAVVFFGSVILLQRLVAQLGNQAQPEIVTVLSTLAIVVLFVPLRNRVQTEIDKRFNRKKYDAQQVLSDFAKTVRDETDLEKLSARLVQVVDETMQPKSVTMWLKRTDKIGSRSKG